MRAAAAARVMNSHLRPIDSTRSTVAAGSATASGKPGKPAPEPISPIRVAARSSGTSSPVRLSSTCTRQARSPSVTELTDARSPASSSNTVSSAARPSGSSAAEGELMAPGRTSLGDERGDDHAAVGLVAFAVGLDPGALFEVLVHDPALLGGHLVHLDRAIAVEGLLCSPIGTRDQDLATALAVPGGIHHDAFALPHPAESGLIAEQLQSVDRLPSFADQEAVVVLACNKGLDPVVALADLDVALEVELGEDALDQLTDPVHRLLRPLPSSDCLRHRPRS